MSYSYGIPVIVPSLGGFPEDVLPKQTGYIFEANSAESLARVLEEVCLTGMVMNGTCSGLIRTYAAERYSWDKSCSTLAATYRNSMKKGKNND
jgi:glycosyltransferase involved in cell wall biosynthesis